jgi:hypothetical protein
MGHYQTHPIMYYEIDILNLCGIKIMQLILLLRFLTFIGWKMTMLTDVLRENQLL